MGESADLGPASYAVTARRKKKWWILETSVEGVAIRARVRRLDQAAARARKTIAQRLHPRGRSFVVELYVDLPSDLQGQLDRTREAFQESATARAHAALLGHGTAKLLKKQRLGKRDIGALMGVSPGRVSKLLGEYRSAREV